MALHMLFNSLLSAPSTPHYLLPFPRVRKIPQPLPPTSSSNLFLQPPTAKEKGPDLTTLLHNWLHKRREHRLLHGDYHYYIS